MHGNGLWQWFPSTTTTRFFLEPKCCQDIWILPFLSHHLKMSNVHLTSALAQTLVQEEVFVCCHVWRGFNHHGCQMKIGDGLKNCVWVIKSKMKLQLNFLTCFGPEKAKTKHYKRERTSWKEKMNNRRYTTNKSNKTWQKTTVCYHFACKKVKRREQQPQQGVKGCW